MSLMCSMRRHPLTAGMLLALLPFAHAVAAPPAYGVLQVQARTNLLVNDNGYNLPPGSSFSSVTPHINASGQVTFPVQVVTDPEDISFSGIGIWSGGAGVGSVVEVLSEDTGETAIGDRAWINASGQIAYYTHAFGPPYRLRLYDPQVGASSIVSAFPLTPSTYSAVVVADNGVIGYQANFAGSGRGFASTGDGVSVLHAADSGVDPVSDLVYLYTPAMNNERLIAGKVSVGDYSHNEIRMYDVQGNYTTLAVDQTTDSESPFRSFSNSVAVNDAGAVAVSLRLVEGNVEAVYRFQDGEAVEIARVGRDGLTALDAFAPAINNAGLVAFRGSDANGQTVFVGDGEGLVRVFGKGDTLETDLGTAAIGQHDNSVIFGGAPSINDDGLVVAIAGVHPEADNQIEWGSAVIVAYPLGSDVFSDGFEDAPPGE